MDDRPIGVFDSGVGGLSIVAALRDCLPAEDIVYFGDTAHCPYGPRSAAEIRALTTLGVRRLLDEGAKLIVVACNTASVAALAHVRARFATPFVGVVPAVKPAASLSQARRIGVIATPATVEAEYLAALIQQFAAGVSVHARGCPGLVEQVETGELDSARTEAMLREYLAPLLAAGIDALVLGCTHYPLLRPAIQRLVGPEVTIIETGPPVARQTRRVLEEHGRLTRRRGPGELRLIASGDDRVLRWLARRIGDSVAR